MGDQQGSKGSKASRSSKALAGLVADDLAARVLLQPGATLEAALRAAGEEVEPALAALSPRWSALLTARGKLRDRPPELVPVRTGGEERAAFGETLSAGEAAALLGIKKQTLYVYVSRGLLRSARVRGGTARRYLRDDVMRLKARSDVRAGRPLSAVGALHYGAPVIDSTITLIDTERGPVYRGHEATALARRGVSAEQVARLLWTGALPPEPVRFRSLHPRVPRMKLVEDAPTPLARIEAALFFLGRSLPRYAVPDETKIAEDVLQTVRDVVGVGHPAADAVLADHELNPSTFAARVAASTGASLIACLQAAVATFSGPRHGGACDRIEALLDEIGRPGRARDVVKGRLARGDDVPGFFAGIYTTTDPRSAVLLEQAEAKRPGAHAAHALIAAMKEIGGPQAPGPSVDLALVALARGAGWPRGVATAVFAAARMSGWIAHVLEQRGSADVLRPRARFTGSRDGA